VVQLDNYPSNKGRKCIDAAELKECDDVLIEMIVDFDCRRIGQAVEGAER
jgi:hypothetical protein